MRSLYAINRNVDLIHSDLRRSACTVKLTASSSLGCLALGWKPTGTIPGAAGAAKGLLARVAKILGQPDVEVVNLGLIDTPEKAFAAGHEFRRADVDLIFLYVTTYALSSTVLPVVRRAKVPVILLNLTPGTAIDYESFNKMGDRTKMTGEWLAHCQACPVPEIANVFKRCQIPFFQVTGMLENDALVRQEIAEWIDAARVAHRMEHNRLGVMGHYYGGMLDVYSDLTQQCAYFGGHIEIIEIDELSALRRNVTREEILSRLESFRDNFDVQTRLSAGRTGACSTYLGRSRSPGRDAQSWLAGVLLPRCRATRKTRTPSARIILGTSLLTARGIPVAGEYEIKNAQAMKIMDTFGAAVLSRNITPWISRTTCC